LRYRLRGGGAREGARGAGSGRRPAAGGRPARLAVAIFAELRARPAWRN